MSFLVDTDICSAHLKNVSKVSSRFIQHAGSLYLSAVSLGELATWALRSKARPAYLQGLITLLSDMTVLSVDLDVAWKFGEIHGQLLDRGLPVHGMDLLIAATALAHNLTLVTHNIRHFANVPGLTVVDWAST
jgi:tRNA(fMet)-specific endonuclease VapC